MDYQEAIRDIQFLARRYDELPDVNYSVSRESLDVAILSILELQKYRTLGTLEEVRAAVEKQKANRVKNREVMWGFYGSPYAIKGDCPVCRASGILSTQTDYCHVCGQKLDWSVSE